MVARSELVWGTRSVASCDGVDVHVEAAGPAAGTAVAALHGFGSGTFTWAGVAPAWADARPVVAWDRPPFGRSERPAPRVGAHDPYRLEAELVRSTAVVAGHLDRTGADGVVLVGHSAGALLAVQLTLHGGLPVRGLVLLAPALAGEPPAAVRRLAGLPGAGRVGSTALGLALLGTRPALRLLSRHPSPLIEATAAETARCLRRPGTAQALWHLTASWTPPDLEGLGPLGVPTMVIGGLDDRISPPAATREVADRLGGELHLLEGVGHAPQEQVPDLIAPLVGAFVAAAGR